MRDTFVLYSNYYNILKDIPTEDAGYLFKAILGYVSEGIKIEIPAHLELAFGFIKNQLDVDEIKYYEKVKRLKENGRKGGLAKAEKNDDEYIPPRREQEEISSDTDKNTNTEIYTHEVPEQEINHNASYNSKPVPDRISEDKKLLTAYVKKNIRGVKNVEAYVSKIIRNGDGDMILKRIREAPPEKTREERIRDELASIHDRKSALKVLGDYYERGDPPEEFNEVMVKYDLDTYDKAAKYCFELRQLKLQEKLSMPS